MKEMSNFLLTLLLFTFLVFVWQIRIFCNGCSQCKKKSVKNVHEIIEINIFFNEVSKEINSL